jgi:hypothetical protein
VAYLETWVSTEYSYENISVSSMFLFDRAGTKLLKNLKGRDYLEDLGTDGKILEWILHK